MAQTRKYLREDHVQDSLDRIEAEIEAEAKAEAMRTFESGATRDGNADKLVYEAFLSPHVLRVYAEYMHQKRQTPDGLRDGDNWQKGIPVDVYMDSLVRHVMELWEAHRDQKADVYRNPTEINDLLCAIMFNSMGILFERVKPHPPERFTDLNEVTTHA